MNNLATQKAIFTSKTDFQAAEGSPPLYSYDGETVPTGGLYKNGTPTFADGVRGKAAKFGTSSLTWGNVWIEAVTKATLSLWVKPSASDLAASTWRILATNRGDGWSDRHFHLALYGGAVNARVYTATASVNFYSSDTGQSGKKLQANQWYHIALIYDKTTNPNTRIMVNGEQWASSHVAGNLDRRQMSITIGDMLTSAGASQYPFDGLIDEFKYTINDEAQTRQQVIDEYNAIMNGEFVDYQTEEGAIQLGRGLNGLFPTNPVSWISPSVDLGTKFKDFGFIQANGTIPSGTSMSFHSRTSADGTDWNDWVAIGEDGKIKSPNLRHVQLKVDLQTTDIGSTPTLYDIRIFEEVIYVPPPVIKIPDVRVKATEPLYLYRDLETGLDSLGVLKHAYDILIEEEINGEDKLTFKLPVMDKKRKEIGDNAVEMIAVIGERYYVVKEIKDKRGDDGRLHTEFICEARWTELRDWYVGELELVEVTAKQALDGLVANIFREPNDPLFDWSIGNVEITKKRTIRNEWSDFLSLVRAIQNEWGGEVFFDNKDKKIHLLERIGKDSGIRFYYNKNLKNIERQIETYDLVTRIYPTGKGGLDITTVNNGVPYIEDLTWVNKLQLRRKIIPYKWKDERYTIPQNLLEDSRAMLNEMSKPTVRYATSVHDLSALTGHEHESFDLGDTVTIVDDELFDEEIVNRIVRRKTDVRKPENTEVELSQPSKTLADIQSRALDEQIQALVESDPLSTTDIQQMTVFNQLLNSRADDGTMSWVHEANGTQFELDNSGFSGDWSYKVVPNFGKSATMTQTVEGVSHRSTYTISAAVATKGKITRGSSEDAFIGLKVLVYYEGEDEPEVHYLGIPDITQQESEEINYDEYVDDI